jgi:ribonuclease VapC
MGALIVDTSALLSILLREHDANAFAEALSSASRLHMAAPVWLETAMVATVRNGEVGGQEAVRLIEDIGIEVAPVDRALAEAALDGWRRYGKGRHPAALNFGDCFSYALAKVRNEPLLFKGGDFSLTDVEPAL